MEPTGRKTSSLWQGIRLRAVSARPDPDAPACIAHIPFAWDDASADALCALTPARPARIDTVFDDWARAWPADFAREAHGLLIARRAAPSGADAFVLDLAAFFEPGFGFDAQALGRAVHVIASQSDVLGVCDLDLLLALEGLDYGTGAARARAVEVIRLIAAAAPSLTLRGQTPGAVEALLGAETGGIAPAFSPLGMTGGLTRAAQARIAARGLTMAAAVAALLAGEDLLPMADHTAHARMYAALAPWMELPAMTSGLPAAATRRELPAHAGGIARRITIGGQRVFLRTGEYADGTPGELTVSVPQATPTARGWAEAFGHVASLGLQYGVPVAELAHALVNTRFGPSGVVEGDPDVTRATSPADYLARALVAAYAPETALPEAEHDEEPPLLPLELPQRPRLRLVG